MKRNIPVTQVTLIINQGTIKDQAKSEIEGIASDTAANQIAANRIIKERLVSDGLDLRSYRCTMHLVRNRIRNKILLYLKNLTYVLTISSKIQVCTIKK